MEPRRDDGASDARVYGSVFSRIADVGGVTKKLATAAAAARRIAQGHPRPGDAAAMTHAWLFTGPPGSGRSVAAVCLAAALVCTDPHEVGCGRCEACRKVLSDVHGDVTHIVPTELSISVATMRDVIRQASSMPSTAPWRIVIVEDADRLSDSAANAVLKTVEEPAAQTVIMLCAPSTDPTDISVTLRSRCRHIYVPTPPVEEVVRLLTASGQISESDARLAATSCVCHVGRAKYLATTPEAQRRRVEVLSLAELIFYGQQAFLAVTGLVSSINKEALAALEPVELREKEELNRALGVGAAGKGTARGLRGSASDIKALEDRQKMRRVRAQRDSLDLALLDLAGIYRDALMVSTGSGISPIHPDMGHISSLVAKRVSVPGIIACVDAISKAREHLRVNVKPTIALDGMVGRLRLACHAS